MKIDENYVIAVDYDGVLFVNKQIDTSWIKTLKKLQLDGVIIVLWTCRYGKQLQNALDMLESKNFVPNYVNEYPLRRSSNKINADIYIDDCNCDKRSINKLLSEVKTNYKRKVKELYD